MPEENYQKLDELMDYLTADEKLISKYRIGFYDVVITTERLILLRKFPPLFIEIGYDDIHNLEHHTMIMWRELANSLALFTLSAVVFLGGMGESYVGSISRLLRAYLPELANVVPVLFTLQALMAASAALAVFYFIRFIPSVWGYFRISRKDRAPVNIPTGMTPELKNLIRDIEGQMRQVGERRKTEEVQYAQAAYPEQQLSPKEGIRAQLESKAAILPDNSVILISSKSENHAHVVSGMLDILVKDKMMGGVYISISRPYEFIVSTMSSAGVPSDDIYFIDCISRMAGKGHLDKNEKVVFVENPSSLEEVSMYLDKMLSKVQSQKKFLFMDSLSSLLIYNTDKSVKEFTHFIINKIRLENIAGIILSIEKKEAEDLVKTLAPMCDTELKF